MSKATFVIFGRPGAGKSTLINKLSNATDAHVERSKVERSKFKDGTDKVKVIQQEGVTYVDTPGLGSDEFRLSPASIRDECLKVGSNNVIVLLVLSKQVGKVTTLRTLFTEQLKYFENPVFAIVWSRKADDLDQYEVDKKEAKEHFGRNLQGQFDMETTTQILLESLRIVPSTGFTTDLLKDSPSNKRKKTSTVVKIEYPTIIDSTTKIEKVAPTARQNTIARLQSSVSVLNTPLKADEAQKTGVKKAMDEAFKELQDMNKSLKFSKYKEVGDALLRALVYYSVIIDEPNLSEGLVHICGGILGNKPDDVMSMFFDQHAPDQLTKEHAPGISYSAHTKADYVEALYHYAGESDRPKVQKYVLSWILKEGKKKIAASRKK